MARSKKTGKPRPKKRRLSEQDVLKKYSLFICFFASSNKERYRFELVNLSVLNDQQRREYESLIQPKGDMTREEFLESKDKVFWKEHQLDKALRMCKEYGFLRQSYRNGPYSVSSEYVVSSLKARLIKHIEQTPFDRLWPMDFLGFICGFPERLLDKEDKEQLRRISDGFDSTALELEKLRFRMLLRDCVGDPSQKDPTVVRERLVSFLYLFLRTRCGWDRSPSRTWTNMILENPRHWLTQIPLLPLRLKGATMYDFLGPRMQSLLREEEWERLAGIFRSYGLNYDFSSEELPDIHWEYDRFLREYLRNIITVLDVHTDIWTVCDKEWSEMTREYLSNLAESWYMHDKCQGCPHAPKRTAGTHERDSGN